MMPWIKNSNAREFHVKEFAAPHRMLRATKRL
jgi:hypothetical protein